MSLAWLRLSILISNIILSNQLSPPAIMTSTKCATENQKIQGFNPSQFFHCVRKENELYFETRYCPSVKNTFYEAEQRCLPNIGGGEVRCLIPGKRCSHNKLGPMAYPNKFKPNYYIVCLPKATHICRCYGNAIYDAGTQMCRIISTTTDMGRDDSNGMIPKIICERSGMHSTVELQYPNKQKCVLFCYQNNTNDQFKLNIICATKTNLVDANVNIDSIINGEENLHPEIKELIAQEFLKSTNSYDNLGWPIEKSTTESSQNEEKQTRTDITSIPTGETFLGSSSPEDLTITWTTDQNITEKPLDSSSLKYDETTSKKIVFTSLPTKVGSWSSDISHTLNERPTSTQLSEFSSEEGKADIRTTEKVTAQDGSVQWNSDKILVPFLKDDEITIQASETSLASSTIQDDTTQSVTTQNFKESHANTSLSTTEYESAQSTTDKNFTQRTASSLFLITEDGSMQSTVDNNFNEIPSSQLNLITEEETTITSVSYTTEDENTKWTTNRNTIENPSGSQFTTNEDIIQSSSEKTSLVSLIAEDEEKRWTQDQNFKKSTANTLKTIMEDETTNNFSENLSLTSVNPEGVSMQSTADQTFRETPKTPFSVTTDSLKATNPDTKLLITEEETTNPSKTIITTVSSTTEDVSTKWTINQNTIETSSSSQFLTTEDKITSSSDKTSLVSLIAEDEEKRWTQDQNFKNSTYNTLKTIMEDETTNHFSENFLLTSVNPEGVSMQSIADQTFTETPKTPFSATNDGTKLLITEEETTNPSKTITTTVSPTTEDGSTKWTINQNTIETSSSSQFFTTEDKITSSSDKTSLATLIPEEGKLQWTTNRNLRKSTANTLSTIMENETTNQFDENILLSSGTSDEGSIQSTTNQNSKETSSIPFSTTDEVPKETNTDTKLVITKEETTNPSKTILTTVSNTTENKSTQWTINQNTIETSSSSQFLTTEDKITSGDKTSLISLLPEKEKTEWSIDLKKIPELQDLDKSTANTLSTIMEDGTANQFSENLSLTSVTPEEVSMKTTADQIFTETSKTPFSTTNDGLKATNPGTKLLITEEETTNPLKIIITTVSSTTEDGSTKWTINQNTLKTSSSSQTLTTEDKISSSGDKTSLIRLLSEDGETTWIIDQDLKKSTANTLSTIMENETNKNLLFSSVTPEERSIQSMTYQKIKETSSYPFSATDDIRKETNPGTKLPITEDTTKPLETVITSISYTSENRNTKWITNQNTIETSSSSNFLTTEDILKTSSEKTSIASVIPEDTDTTDQHFKKSTANTLSTIMDDKITNQFSENLLLASVTPEGQSVRSTTYQDFKETSGTPFLTTVDSNLKETSSGNLLQTTDDEMTNQSNDNLILASVTPGEESTQSTTYQDFEESSGTPFSTTVDSNLKETSSDNLLQTTDDKVTNQSNDNLILASVTPGEESTQSTTYQDFEESSGTPFSTTVNSNLKETGSDNLLQTTDDKVTNQSNDNLILASVTPGKESTQSTTYQDFKESSGTPFSTTVDSNLKETSSGNLLQTTNDKITNQSNDNLLLASVTPEGQSVQSTTYQDFKEASNVKETNSDNLLQTTDDKITNQFNDNLLLASVTPEGESIKSTLNQKFKESTSNTQFSTTVDVDIKETNSDIILLVTEDVTTNESSKNFLLQNTTPEGESTQFSPYNNFKENTSNSLLSTTENGKVDFKQTTSITLSPIMKDETTKSSSENNLLASLITEDESVISTPNEHSKQTTSGTQFSITDETITPTSEIIAVESLSTKSGNINSIKNQENFNSFEPSSTTEHNMPTTEFFSPDNRNTELPGTEVTSRTDLLSSIAKQLTDEAIQEKLNTTPSPATSELLTPETESEISTLKITSSAIYDDGTKLNYIPPKSDQVTLNSEKNLQSTISESTSTPTILFLSNTQSQEIETKVNTLPSSSTEFTSTIANITRSISSLSQTSTIASSTPILNDSKNFQTNTPQENLQSTASSPYSTSDTIVPSTAVTALSKKDKENLLSTSLNVYSQSISTTEDTAKPINLSTTLENLFTTEIDTRLPVQSSTASDYYKYQSIIPVSDITNSVNTLLPAEAISESTPENSQQTSTSSELYESKENATEISSTGYSSTTRTTGFIKLADADKDDYNTEAFTTIKNVKSNLNVEQIDSDQNSNGSPQSSVELEISTIAIKPNWDVTSSSETFASNKYLEESEYDPSSQGTYFGMAERCVCTGKRRFRNSCKKHYHCSRIGSLNRFIQSEITECAYCLQFNAKKRVCDFPENVPECAVDDGSINRRCTAEGNYSIPLERNCRKYYECKRNWRGVIALEVKICQVGRIFSERLQKCVKGCRCRNAQQLPDRCEYKNAVLPDRFDCSKYYYCNNEMEIQTLQCSDQYVFDGERCELKSDVICDPSKVYRYLSDDDDENCNT